MKRFIPLYISFPILVGALVLATGCKKLIEIPSNPPDEIPESQVFNDSADIISAIVGIYSNFKTTNYTATFGSGAITVYGGLTGDELHSTSASDNLSREMAVNAISIDNSNIASLWQGGYTNIYQINVCLKGLGATTAISDSLRRQLVAEVKVVRAFYYFNMVNLFGRLPIITGTDYKENAVISRSSVDSVYRLIQSDLADARAVLQPAYPSAGHMRPNLYTAEALSAKVFLYRQQWDSAASMAADVISKGGYTLETDLNSVFLDGSVEAIWQLPANGSYSLTSEATSFVSSYGGKPGYSLTDLQLNAFETGDQRKDHWVSSVNVAGTDYFYPFKYKARTIYDGLPTEAYMIFRLGEQYLILAEAQAHQGQLSDARDNIDVIRGRAGLSGSTVDVSSQTDVLAAIQHERQTELFCEWGNRWFDLKRTGTIDAVLGVEKPNIWQPYAALYPIPKVEIQNNYRLTQNDGY